MNKRTMHNTLSYWYLPLIVGVLYIVLGVGVIFTPITFFLLLTAFLSIGITISGILEFAYAIINRSILKNWIWLLFGAIINVIVGIYLVINLGFTATMLSIFIGVWALLRSIIAIINSFIIKRRGEKQWVLVLILAIIGVGLSSFMLWHPLYLGKVTMIWIGIGLLAIGILHILISILFNRIRKVAQKIQEKQLPYYEID